MSTPPAAIPSPPDDGRSASSQRYVYWFHRGWPLLPLLLVTFYYVAQAAWVFPTRLMTPYTVSVVEAQPIAGALRVVDGKPLYRDFRTGRPVLPLTYLGLTYEVPGWTARVSGWTSALDVARIGRVLSLASFAGIVILLIALATQRGVSPRWGWLAVLPLFWFPHPAEWFAKYAPDAPALFFSLLGWWFARPPAPSSSPISGSRAEQASPRALSLAKWRSVAAVAAWLIGFHFKPSILIGPIAFGVESLHAAFFSPSHDRTAPTRPFLRLVILGAAFIGAALASLVILAVTTHGAWNASFLQSTAAFRYDPAFIVENLHKLRPEGLVLFFLFAAWCGWAIRKTPVAAAFFLALLFNLALMMKQGSNVNYLLGPIAVGGLAIVVAANRFIRDRTNADPPRRGAPIFLWPALLLSVFLLIHPAKSRVLYWEIFQPSAEELHTIDATLKSVPRNDILCLDAFYGLSRGLPILFADPFHVAVLEQHGLVSFAPEARRLDTQSYKLVIWNLLEKNRVHYQGVPVYSERLSQALEAHYRIVYQGNWLVVWTPKMKGK